MPREAPNKMPAEVKRRYFQLIRAGMKGAAAARVVGVSTSCGSLWFLDAGGVLLPDAPISPRFFSQDDRIAIADGLRASRPVKAIAAELGKSYQSVYREIRRNRKPDGSYQPWWAHNQALQRRRRPKTGKIAGNAELRRAIHGRLAVKWSPQQICRWLARTHPADPSMRVCPETIYRALFAGRLGTKAGRLRTGRTVRRRHRRGVPPPNKIKNMRLLSHRPAHVTDRSEPGHWEGDLLIGAKMTAAVATLVERASRYTLLVHLPHGYKAPQLRDALVQALKSIPARMRKTLTWDQGREMALHQDTEAATGTLIYFCDPHSPWQRPTNENTNGLLRQYFPKHTDLRAHDARTVQQIARELNRRPRLILGDRTPDQVMRQYLAAETTT